MAKRIYTQPDTTAVPQVPVDDSTNPRAMGFAAGKHVGEWYDRKIWEPLARARNPEGYAMLKQYEVEGTPVYAEDFQVVARGRPEAQGWKGNIGGVGASMGAMTGARALGGWLAKRAAGTAIGGAAGTLVGGPVGTAVGAVGGFIAPLMLERFISQAAGIQTAGGDPLTEDILIPGMGNVAAKMGGKFLKSGLVKGIGKKTGEATLGKEAMQTIESRLPGARKKLLGVPVGEAVSEAPTAAQLRREFLDQRALGKTAAQEMPVPVPTPKFDPTASYPPFGENLTGVNPLKEMPMGDVGLGRNLPMVRPSDAGQQLQGWQKELLLKQKEGQKLAFERRVDKGALLKGTQEIRRGRATTVAINGPGVLPQDPTDVIGSPRWQEALQEEIRARFGANVSPQQIRQAAASELSKGGIPPTADITASLNDALNQSLGNLSKPGSRDLIDFSTMNEREIKALLAHLYRGK